MFNIYSKSFYLTYPQCPIPMEEACSQLTYLLTNKRKVLEWMVAEEKHQDGQQHLHAFFLLDRKIHVRNPRHFDLVGPYDNPYHGNYQSARNRRNVLVYCMKDSTYITNISVPDLPKLGMQSNYTKCIGLAREGKTGEALALAETKLPKDFLMHHNALTTTLIAMRPRSNESFLKWEDFKVKSLPEWGREKTLVIWGETGTGKSSLAKLLLPNALFCRHLDTLKQYKPEEMGGNMNGIIFDDLSFVHLPMESQIHLMDNFDESQIHCRHTCALIPAMTWKIVTTNKRPSEILGLHNQALVRRILTIKLIMNRSGKKRKATELNVF